MVGTTLKLLMDENATEKYNQVQLKKLTVPTQEANTKRAALGDLQNRNLTRDVSSKNAAQKEVKDNKLPNALRNAKPRVDTHWKKQPTANPAAAVAKPKAPLLRANSMRTNAAGGGALTRQASASSLATGSKVSSKPAAAAAAANTKPLKSKLSSEALPDQKPTVGTSTTLRREDSNLTQKSLNKLRVALGKPALGVAALTKKETVPKKEPSKPKPKTEIVAATSEVSTLSLSSKRLAGIEDIDANDKENLILVSEYVNDIYDYLYKLEIEQPIHIDHLADQVEVTHKMRAVLIDWMNEVHMQFHLAPESFQLAVAITDRYLQVVSNTKRSYLQLVGVTALFLATKYEELFPPAIGDFVFITDDTYTARQIRMMELQIFKAIDCNLSRPLPIHFLRRYSKAADAEDSHHAMSKYFVELATTDYELASYRPSEIAAASLFLALNLLNGNYRASTGLSDRHWTPTLTHYSRYTATHLRPITRQIAKLARDAPQAKLRSIYNKYQSNKFLNIAQRNELSGALIDSIIGLKKSATSTAQSN